jgi:Domain of unknown function (DUF4880)
MDTQTIEATAARWLLKREEKAWTESDQIELDCWLNESTLHRIAFIRLYTVWQQMGSLQALESGEAYFVTTNEAFLWLLRHGFPVSVERQALHIVLRRRV